MLENKTTIPIATYRSPDGSFCQDAHHALSSCWLRDMAASCHNGADLRNLPRHNSFSRLLDGTPFLFGFPLHFFLRSSLSAKTTPRSTPISKLSPL